MSAEEPAGENERSRLLARIAFWMLVLVTTVLALMPQPPQLPGEPSDKLQHMLAFAVLTASALAGYPGRWLAVGVGLLAFGALVELLQMIPGLEREADLDDWIADAGAVAAVIVLALFIARIGRPLKRRLQANRLPR